MSNEFNSASGPRELQPQVASASQFAQAPVPASTHSWNQTMRPATGASLSHASIPVTTPAATQNATIEAPQTLNERVNAVDRYWKFKGAIQVGVIVSGLIGIGAVASLTATWPHDGYFFANIPDAPWPSMISFGISIVWCLSCFANIVRCKRPFAPGARVAWELLLWLGFGVSCFFATIYFESFLRWGADKELHAFSSYEGSYELQSNNTWVWMSGGSFYSYPRTCGSHIFRTCEQQDAYINEKWSQKPHRTQIELMSVVCQYISLTLHLTLFVWACIDTHMYNNSKVSQDAEKLAANIIETMVNNGAIIPPPGQARMRPIPWGQPSHYALPQQGSYPMVPVSAQNSANGRPTMHAHSMSEDDEKATPLPPRPMASSVNEKSEGPHST